MSASGKSSNRRYEQARGYYGGGHGIYAAMGKQQREAEDERRQQAADEEGEQPWQKTR